MRIFRFDLDDANALKEYESTNIFISPILQTDKAASIHCLSFEPRSKIGLHQVMSSQLFLVTAGEGWTRGDSPEPMSVQTGDAVFWETGEWLEAGSDTGMTVIVVESRIPDPFVFSVRQGP